MRIPGFSLAEAAGHHAPSTRGLLGDRPKITLAVGRFRGVCAYDKRRAVMLSLPTLANVVRPTANKSIFDSVAPCERILR